MYSNTTPTIEDDIQWLRSHDEELIGWQRALRIVRNVRESTKGGQSTIRIAATAIQKITANTLAKKINRPSYSARNIQYYLTAWRMAAEDGLVPAP
jgi:hypothetical protein